MRNAIFYRIKTPFSLDAAAIEEAIQAKPFLPCEKNQIESIGWGNPRGMGHACGTALTNDCILLRLIVDAKKIPRGAIRDHVEEHRVRIEEAEGRKLPKKELRDIEDQVLAELVQKTPSKKASTYAYIDLITLTLIVGASSEKNATAFTAALREALGSLPIEPLKCDIPVAATLTAWLREDAVPDGIEIGDAAILTDEEGGTVTFKKQFLLGRDVQDQIAQHKQVTKLNMTFNERIQLTLDENLQHTKMKLTAAATESVKDLDDEDGEAIFDATMFLVTQEYRLWLQAMKPMFSISENQGELF